MPHIGLNLVFLVPGETGGMEVYARNLIESLLRVRPDLRLTAFVNLNAAGAPGPWNEIESVTVPVDSRSRVKWVLGEQLLLPPKVKRAGVDLLHSPANLAPAWGGFKRILTVHDLIHRTFPEAHAGVRAKVLSVIMPLGIRRSHRLIADSNATRDDLVKLLHEREEKIDVVPLGLGEAHPERAMPEPELREKLRLGDRAVALSLSAKRPHKNLIRLLDALASIPPERRPVLVIPGYMTWHERELEEHARRLGIEDDVRLLGWATEEVIEALYAAAGCFVFPSLYEGFGLPVLEAMQRGVPVACSDRTSLPEVAGGAALMFDPERPDEIAAAIERLLNDRDEAERLRAAGRARAAQFSWDDTARMTAESYDRALAR
ncbi:MAG TPA: glycosyltransferase family 1 protein [Thermoleophilaceae bacterium]|nr:glycosyltransferase family 1 protein [Thermoleophilaceae bacterium]